MSNVQSLISIVYCQFFIVQSPLLNVHCPMHIVQCPLSNFQCPFSNVQCQLSNVRCVLSIIKCPFPIFHLFHRSIVPSFHCSIVPTFQRSNVPTFQRSNVPTFYRSIVVLHHSIKNSWFTQVRDFSEIPFRLWSPPKQRKHSNLISYFWRDSLIAEAESLTSLRYMRLSFLPLGHGAHPLCWTC